MRDSLIELIQDSVQGCARHWAEVIADHLLANGVVVPPCKVGQTVYRVYWNNSIDTCRVSALTQKSDKSWKIRVTSGINKSVFEITPDKLGKTVFLTREEAEQKLKEGAEE